MNRVVILGGGFGGVAAARAMAKSPAQITLVDSRNHHLFQPLLYQVATAGLSPADIAAPIRGLFRDQKNIEVRMAQATGIKPWEQIVELNDGELAFDYLVVATGAMKHYFGHPEWEAHAPGLKSIEDATNIRNRILTAFERAESEPDEVRRKEWLHFVIVGGGPTGVELAGAIAELSSRALAGDFRHINPQDAKITLVEAGAKLLAFLPESLSLNAQQALNRLGVNVMLNTMVQNIAEENIDLGSQVIKSRTKIWAAGVKPTPLTSSLGVSLDKMGRVPIDPYCRAPGSQNIFVVGDAAVFTQDGEVVHGLAPIAKQQGAYAGRVISRLLQGKGLPEPFRYRDKGIISVVGRSHAVAKVGPIKSAGMFTWFTWWLVHIYYLANFRNRASVFLQWLWSYLTFEKGARLITK